MENQKFLEWFLGFIDAEGNFQTTIVKRLDKDGNITHYTLQYSIHLSLQIRDKELLEFIKKMLNNKGIIYNYEKRKETHLSIARNEDLIWLIDNIFSKYPLLTVYQSTRLEQIKFGINNQLKRINKLEDFNNYIVKDIIPNISYYSSTYWENWLTGFINGEASFTFVTKKNKKNT